MVMKKKCREKVQKQYNKINFKSHNENVLIELIIYLWCCLYNNSTKHWYTITEKCKDGKTKNCTLQNWVCFAIVCLFVWMVFCANSNLYSFLCFDFEHYCQIVVSVWKGTTVPAVPNNRLILNNCLFSP